MLGRLKLGLLLGVALFLVNDQEEAAQPATCDAQDGSPCEIIVSCPVCPEGVFCRLTPCIITPGICQNHFCIVPSPEPVVSPSPNLSPFPTPSSSPASAAKAGDANNDNKVDGVDYVVWLSHYNQSVTGAGSGDFNNSGKVDGVDYVVWLNNFGK